MRKEYFYAKILISKQDPYYPVLGELQEMSHILIFRAGSSAIFPLSTYPLICQVIDPRKLLCYLREKKPTFFSTKIFIYLIYIYLIYKKERKEGCVESRRIWKEQSALK